ncbi:hypothetical protein ANCCAN_18021 [Ancylostoma caninum]|uniref:Uncharacterized protein n=1 Tax=Ancylostoma caninum TaxID=29170 RepID=A0A368FVB4_ANCCA|nr:hypothetical protein ANCCAN_18021 [Ancylostoma caninum]
MVELYASVITGFEGVSSEEVSTTFASDPVRGRGCVRFRLDPSKIPQALHLRSVDNLFAVLYDYELEGLTTASQEEALKKIKGEISRINWKTAIECWQIACGKQVPGGVETVKDALQSLMTIRGQDEHTKGD